MNFNDKVSKVLKVADDFGLSVVETDNPNTFIFIESDGAVEYVFGACVALDLDYINNCIDYHEFKIKFIDG